MRPRVVSSSVLTPDHSCPDMPSEATYLRTCSATHWLGLSDTSFSHSANGGSLGFIRPRGLDPPRNALGQGLGAHFLANPLELFPRPAPLQVAELFLDRNVQAERGQAAEENCLLLVGLEILGQPQRPTPRH